MLSLRQVAVPFVDQPTAHVTAIPVPAKDCGAAGEFSKAAGVAGHWLLVRRRLLIRVREFNVEGLLFTSSATAFFGAYVL